MLFSIITITRNNLEGLKATSRSLAAQNCNDYEWIVIDGASDDATTDYLQSSAANWVSETDAGIYDAMNKGLFRAKGEYLLFMNAGDLFASPCVLDEIGKSLECRSVKPDFIYGDAMENGNRKTARRHTSIKNGMFTHHQAMLYRRDAIGELLYDTSYIIAADYDFTCRFLMKNNNSLYIPLPVCIFETGGISQREADTGRKEQSVIRWKLELCTSLENSMITQRQKLAWLLRSRLPGFFWYLKN